MDILDKLKSQIGDDVQHIFDHEALFKLAVNEITALRTRLAEVEAANRGLVRLNEATEARAQRAEAALATARRDALEEAAMVAYEHFPAAQDMESTRVCNALEDVAAAIRALIAQEEPTT